MTMTKSEPARPPGPGTSKTATGAATCPATGRPHAAAVERARKGDAP